MIATIRSACTHVPAGVTTSYGSPLLKLIALPLHASLPPADQLKVFQPAVKEVSRKVIFATNVAETSLTIPGIKFVVDTCRAKARTFDPVTGFESLKIERISKAQAEQRAGRAGRQGPGTAYRLLTEQEYEQLNEFSVPEILRVNLANVLMQLIAIGISDVLTFDFMDRPKLTNFETALDELKSLGAVQEEDSRDAFKLTSLGQEMISFPLEPKYARILVASKDFGCTDELLTVISLLFVDNIFYIPPHKRDAAAEVMKKFKSSEGDHIMLLNVYKGWQGSKCSREWCVENYVHIRNIEIVREVRKQLVGIWVRLGNKLSSCGSDTEQVRRCLFTGLQNNVAILQRDGVHRTIGKKEDVHIHPSSCLFQTKPEAIIYSDLVDTSKHYMRNVSLISVDWLPNSNN